MGPDWPVPRPFVSQIVVGRLSASRRAGGPLPGELGGVWQLVATQWPKRPQKDRSDPRGTRRAHYTDVSIFISRRSAVRVCPPLPRIP
jgi:hypothetical protein